MMAAFSEGNEGAKNEADLQDCSLGFGRPSPD